MIQHTKEKVLQSSSNSFCKEIVRILLFLLIGILIFGFLQHIFMPKRFPYEKAYNTARLGYYYNEENNSIDVLIYGTSHPAMAILPMELYELYGIKSYNLATSAQPIEATYYTLEEAIKSQKPKVVVYDVSSLYFESEDSSFWKLAMDDMALGKSKLLLAKEYLKNNTDTGESLGEVVFPLLEYHTRWKDLVKDDFTFFKNNRCYFGKGGNIDSIVLETISVDDMNSMTNELLQNREKVVYEYQSGTYSEEREEDVLYSADIPESNIDWLMKIKKLCDQNKIQLLAVKVPAVYRPQSYSSAWTIVKYNKVKALCEEYGITYYDLLYDTDIGFDSTKDSLDQGFHLNLYGARKVSSNLGNYLREHYELSVEHNEQWDKDFESYQKVRKVALLELEQDFVTYINMLAYEYRDKMIFIAASEDMSMGLNETDINAMRALGLKMDYANAALGSYIAVIDNGEVMYEVLSSRALSYSGVCSKSGKRYELYSSGWWTGGGLSIKLDGSEYAYNSRGLSIVVYDDERELVLDSVSFDTWSEYHTPSRNNYMINELEEAFERYIMEVEDK